jgi:hypothetical protein
MIALPIGESCNLSFPGAGCDTVESLGSSSLRLPTVRGARNDVGVGKGRLGHAAEGLARVRCLAVLLVSREVEGDEEDKVRGQCTNTSEGSKLLASALASTWHP